MTSLEKLEALCKENGLSLTWEVVQYDAGDKFLGLQCRVFLPTSGDRFGQAYYYTSLDLEHARFDLLSIILEKMSVAMLSSLEAHGL